MPDVTLQLVACSYVTDLAVEQKEIGDRMTKARNLSIYSDRTSSTRVGNQDLGSNIQDMTVLGIEKVEIKHSANQ